MGALRGVVAPAPAPPHARRALVLVSLGGLAWLGGGLYYGADLGDRFMIGLLLIAIGMGLAAWMLDRAPYAAAAGFGVAFVGILLFLGNGLGRFDNLARGGSHAFALALLLMGAALLLQRGWSGRLFQAGAAVAVVATLLWIVADLDGGGAWQWGNALAGAGSAWAAMGVRTA